MIAPNIKKYSPQWDQKITTLIGKQIDHTFQKGEKKLKEFKLAGDEVQADSGETVKVNDTELLIAEREKIVKDLEEKKEDLKNKEGYSDKYAEISVAHDLLETKITEWTNNKTAYTNYHLDFLKGGRTNSYRGAGWVELEKVYTTKKWKPTGSSAPAEEYSNLYEGVFYTGNGSNQKSIKMTEQEVIKMITRTIKEFSKIDKAEFVSLTTTNLPSGVVLATGTGTTSADEAKTALDTLQAHASNLVESTDRHTGRKEYTLGHNFVNNDENGMVDAPFNKASIEAYFTFLNFVHTITLLK